LPAQTQHLRRWPPPFLPDTASRDTGQRDAGGAASSSGVLAAPLTLQSPHLDLNSPAGHYSLELGNPATAVLVGHLLRLKESLEKVRRRPPLTAVDWAPWVAAEAGRADARAPPTHRVTVA
jgi:hypothetical protein